MNLHKTEALRAVRDFQDKLAVGPVGPVVEDHSSKARHSLLVMERMREQKVAAPAIQEARKVPHVPFIYG